MHLEISMQDNHKREKNRVHQFKLNCRGFITWKLTIAQEDIQ